jgi:hypothetical protein
VASFPYSSDAYRVLVGPYHGGGAPKRGSPPRFFSRSRFSFALYATGRRESAIFVGLWAPTILNLGQSLPEED